MKKVIFIQNLVAPYRVSLFNNLIVNGLNLEVYYMRLTENDRSWKIDLSTLKYPFYIDKGYYKEVFGFYIHFNPKLISKVVKNRDVEYILGASWNNIDILIICFFKRLGVIRNKLHIWSEANYLTTGSRNDNIVKFIVRKFVFNSIDGTFIVPGEMSVKTFSKWKINVKKFVFLPNVIDETVFCDNEFKYLVRDSSALPKFIVPIRIEEKIKGLINFLKSIGNENVKRAIFYILGDGPDYNKTQNYIAENQLEDNVILVGYCNSNEVFNYYVKSDVFLLPSFTDQSPLTVVEAICMGLPLLISNRCGNHFEALVVGQNGYSFNPDNPVEIKIAFENLMNNRDKWMQMGNISKGLFEQRFRQSKVIARFINEFVACK